MDMGVAGFWSYSHDDNEHDGQAILRLAARLQAEFALVTGETLTIFIDRNDISWGDEWRRRIGTALAETTFFIPVITPLYFKRQECRNELLSFVGQAQSLGAIQLVMPILYVEVPDLADDNSDEACALVARMQYADWRELRLRAEDSAEYRQGVNALAQRLAEISRQYEQSGTQQIDDDSEVDEEGILDLLAAIEQRIPAWNEVMENYDIALEQAMAVSSPYMERLKKLEKQGGLGTSGPVLTVLRGLARDTEPILRRTIQYSKDSLAASIDLDPLILQVLRLLDIYPEFSKHVFNILKPFDDRATGLVDASNNPDFQNWKNLSPKFKGLSKDYRRIIRLTEVVERYTGDSSSLMWNWRERIEEARNVTDLGSGKAPSVPPSSS
jgi:TIR domain